ncbi:MAG: glycosyltransferase [Phytoplasma sp.]|uniref:glycosyltransferase n=1 Tax=Phytoplasma sp. TaxID=2155 RepID=UPI002B4170C5|nr:glycosyltransferase [Phytoplasma sp.]WRH06546.1 MAG: glycosyltransferase [Phytoplasma sp.]
MKIGLFLDCWEPFIGGVVVSTKSLRQGLESLGHEVYIITTEAVPKHKEEDPYIIRIKGAIPLFFKSVKGCRLVITYKKHISQIQALNLDIIHVHTEAGIGYLGLYIHKKLNIPLIYTMHSMYHVFLEKNNFLWIKIFRKIIIKLLDHILKQFISKANIIVVPTKKTLNFLTKRYPIDKEYKIIPSGIQLQKFNPENYFEKEVNILKEKLGLTDFFVCLFIGRISKEKEIDFLIDNFAVFHKQNDKSKFLIIGDGPEKKNLQKKVKKLNLKDKIIFLNFVPNDQIGLYYQLGSVFLNASLFETQGLTYIEALSASLPVVARYDEALDGVIQNNENGFLYNDKEEFFQALKCLYKDKVKHEKMSLKAKQSTYNYKQEIFAEKMIDVYKIAISRNNK